MFFLKDTELFSPKTLKKHVKANLHLVENFLYKFGTAGDLAEGCMRPYWVYHRWKDPEPGLGGIMLALNKKKV